MKIVIGEGKKREVRHLLEAAGLRTGLGCWIDKTGEPVTSLNMTGFWPYIDRCRNYAAILVPLKTEDPKKELYIQFKEKMDAAFGDACK